MGRSIIVSTRYAVVMAVTVSEPKPFMKLCSIRLPAALMLLLCVYQAREKTLSTPARLAISGLIGGGLGNLVDRILFGGVTDYIRLSLIRFPIFNFADICITVSVAALMLLLLFDHFNDKTEDRHG